jgi:hypothetical protein
LCRKVSGQIFNLVIHMAEISSKTYRQTI